MLMNASVINAVVMVRQSCDLKEFEVLWDNITTVKTAVVAQSI